VVFKDFDDDVREVLKGLLRYDPKERLSAKEALQLPYFDSIRQQITADSFPQPCQPSYFDFEFENYELDIKIFKDLIFDEILLYQSAEFREQYL
jgi:mitogen-activated protein kinase 1/3